MPRPPSKNNQDKPYGILTVKAPRWLIELLDSYIKANNREYNRSEIMRASIYYIIKHDLVKQAIDEYLKENSRREGSSILASRKRTESTIVFSIEV